MFSRRERWEALYNQIHDTLSSLGKNDATGEGDFWIVDDDWGGNLQKICITSPEFWSSLVQDKLQKLLADSFTDWGVVVVFSDGSDRRGLIVYADRTEMEPATKEDPIDAAVRAVLKQRADRG